MILERAGSVSGAGPVLAAKRGDGGLQRRIVAGPALGHGSRGGDVGRHPALFQPRPAGGDEVRTAERQPPAVGPEWSPARSAPSRRSVPPPRCRAAPPAGPPESARPRCGCPDRPEPRPDWPADRAGRRSRPPPSAPPPGRCARCAWPRPDCAAGSRSGPIPLPTAARRGLPRRSSTTSTSGGRPSSALPIHGPRPLSNCSTRSTSTPGRDVSATKGWTASMMRGVRVVSRRWPVSSVRTRCTGRPSNVSTSGPPRLAIHGIQRPAQL